MKRIRRDRREYDDSRDTVSCLRTINTNGVSIEVGQIVPRDKTDAEFRKRFWAAGRICYKEDYQPIETDTAKSDIDDVLSEDDKKDALIDRIKEVDPDAKPTRRSKVESLEAKLNGYGLEASAVYDAAIAAKASIDGNTENQKTGDDEGNTENQEGDEPDSPVNTSDQDNKDAENTDSSEAPAADADTVDQATEVPVTQDAPKTKKPKKPKKSASKAKS